MLQPCLPRGLFRACSQGLQGRAGGEGEASNILCLAAVGRPLGKATASHLVVGMMARRVPRRNHHCSILPARQQGPQDEDPQLGRGCGAQAVAFCLLMREKGGNKCSWKEKGTGEESEEINKQTKIPKSIRAEATKQIKVVMATGMCGQQHASPNARN